MGNIVEILRDAKIENKRNQFVCYRCLSEPYLIKLVKTTGQKKRCYFCHSQRKSIELLEFLEIIKKGLNSFYGNAIDELPIEFQKDTSDSKVYFDTYELLTEIIDYPITENQDLLDEISDFVSDQTWCKRNYFELSEHELLLYSWQDFCEIVKYKQRYTFLLKPIEEDSLNYETIPHYSMLTELASIIEKLGLIQDIPTNTSFYRARKIDNGNIYETVEDLGPPPSDKASQNRMSPFGISMFYSSNNYETALSEIDAIHAYIGEFTLLKDIQIINFVNLPEEPSIFDHDKCSLIFRINFIRDFIKEITQPIKNIKDRSIHLEYIPSQIITEYLRCIFSNKITGIQYPSTFGKGDNFVLFINKKDICDTNTKEDKNHLLKLVESFKMSK